MKLEDVSKGPWVAKKFTGGPLIIDSIGAAISQFFLGSTDTTKEQAIRDANFTALAQHAFQIMMRRKWGVTPTWRYDGKVEWMVMFTKPLPPVEVYRHLYDDPYTAIVEADRLFPENAPTNS